MKITKYKWLNIRTGEIVESLLEVIKTEVYDLVNCHFVGVWRFNAKGF